MIDSKRNYMHFRPELRTLEDGGLQVYGYAARFGSETVMWTWEGIEYKEIIAPGAFDDCAMTDVVMNYNHMGKPVARTRNGTLKLTLDDAGLYIEADLGGTAAGRELHDEIKGGYIDRMSFAFETGEEAYDQDTHTRTIVKVKRLYDVAAVDMPAYEQTSISARDYFAAREDEIKRRAARVRSKARAIMLMTAE